MMKIFYFLVAVLAATVTSFAAKIPSTATKEINISKSSQASILIQQTASGHALSKSTMKDLQEALGRKLSLKEKIGWYLYKKQFNPEEPTEAAKRKANSNAGLGFALSLVGILAFPLFTIPGLIYSKKALVADKVDPGILTARNYNLATAGKIIGHIGVGLLLAGLVVILIYLGTYG